MEKRKSKILSEKGEAFEVEIDNFTKLFSQLIKNVGVAGDKLELTGDKVSTFTKTIQDELLSPDGLKAPEIASNIMQQLQDELEEAGKSITIPNLIKQLEDLKVDKTITDSMSQWAKDRNQYVLGVKSLAEELGKQLTVPFEKMTDWIEKIPGGKLLHKAFGFDEIKKRIQQDITQKLAASIKGGTMSFATLKDVGIGAFKSMGGAAKAMFAHPILLAIALIIGGLYLIWKQWNKTIEAAKGLRDATGLTGKKAKELSETLVPIAAQYTSLGVDMETLTKTTGALVNEFQTASILTEGMKTNAGILAGAFGVTEQNAAKVVRLFKTMGVESDEVAYNLQASIANAADLAGVGIDKVFDDLAQSSQEVNLYFKGNMKEAAKTVIELRRMGTTLKEASASAKSMLDFETSIGSELEASVLLGRQLDFGAARYYAFMGDIENQQKEVLKQVGSLEEFQSKLPFQKEAIAKAAGMEVDQLTKMLEQQRLLGQMTAKQKEDYDDAAKQIGEMNKQTADSVIFDKQRLIAQEKFAKIWDQLIYKFSSVLFPIFDAIYKIVDEIFTEIQRFFASDEGKKMLEEIKVAFAELGGAIVKLIPIIMFIMSKAMPVIVEHVKKVADYIKMWADMAAKLFSGDFGGFLAGFGDLFKSIIKMTMSAFSLVPKMILNAIFGPEVVKMLDDFQNFIAGIFGFIVDAILAPGKAVATLQSAFADLGKGFQEWWAIIYATVFKPFIDAIEWVDGALDSVGNFFSGIFGGGGEESTINTKDELKGWYGTDGQVPETATGGVVTRPQVRLVGEAGPEAIVPLDKAGSFGDNSKVVSKLDELISKSDSMAVTKKLDELIDAIQSMSIVMDHRKVGEILATNTSHPGLG